jgi:hypothetical protein
MVVVRQTWKQLISSSATSMHVHGVISRSCASCDQPWHHFLTAFLGVAAPAAMLYFFVGVPRTGVVKRTWLYGLLSALDSARCA